MIRPEVVSKKILKWSFDHSVNTLIKYSTSSAPGALYERCANNIFELISPGSKIATTVKNEWKKIIFEGILPRLCHKPREILEEYIDGKVTI